MAWGSTPAEVGLALSRRLIEEQVPPGEARQDAMATLRVFARTAHPVEVVDRIRGRGPEMIGSPVFAGFIEEGRAMGRQEGRLEGLRDDILAVRWRRASARVPAALATQVEQLADLAPASARLRRALVVESLEAFAQKLAATRLGPRVAAASHDAIWGRVVAWQTPCCGQ